jgi:hypothetical protein
LLTSLFAYAEQEVFFDGTFIAVIESPANSHSKIDLYRYDSEDAQKQVELAYAKYQPEYDKLPKDSEVSDDIVKMTQLMNAKYGIAKKAQCEPTYNAVFFKTVQSGEETPVTTYNSESKQAINQSLTITADQTDYLGKPINELKVNYSGTDTYGGFATNLINYPGNPQIKIIEIANGKRVQFKSSLDCQ